MKSTSIRCGIGADVLHDIDLPALRSRACANGLFSGLEVRTLREKIARMAATGNPGQWLRDLSKTWMENDPAEAAYLYLDGHVRVYPWSLSNSPTLTLLITKPCKFNAAVSVRVLLHVHRNGVIGSPLVSGSTSMSIAFRISGFSLSSRFRPAPGRL